jgi:DNA-binding NarL/FixJ family response regulator
LHDYPAEVTASVRLLLADDFAPMRDMLALRFGLAGDVEVVGEADDRISAVEQACELLPDVLLVDLMLPGPPDLNVVAEVRRRAPQVAVVVLTGWFGMEERQAALASGAFACLVKSADVLEVVVGTVRAAAHQAAGVDVGR